MSVFYDMSIQWTEETGMPNPEILVLKISTFLVTENKLNIYFSFAIGTIFQGIHIALVLNEKLYLIEK